MSTCKLPRLLPILTRILLTFTYKLTCTCNFTVSFTSTQLNPILIHTFVCIRILPNLQSLCLRYTSYYMTTTCTYTYTYTNNCACACTCTCTCTCTYTYTYTYTYSYNHNCYYVVTHTYDYTYCYFESCCSFRIPLILLTLIAIRILIIVY